MMAADTLMDVLEDIFIVTNGDTSLEDTQNVVLVQLTIDDGEGL